ncbi:MAG: thioredoxin family protein [Clostridiaceae bacterium]
MKRYMKYFIISIISLAVVVIYFAGESKINTNTERVDIQGVPTVIELKTPTCPVCKEMEPIMESLGESYIGKANIKIIDLYDEKTYAEKYNVTAVPTIIFLDEDGNLYYKYVGYMEEQDIEEILNEMGVKKDV